MKLKPFTILVLLLYPLILTISCSNAFMDSGTDSIPYPRSPGIIPLTPYSQRTFSHTVHDSAGNITADILCSTGREYGVINDTTLIPITPDNTDQKFLLYLYEYEWNNLNSGLLISSRDTFVDTCGIYIHGEYWGETKTLYRKPVLWYKYPGSIGDIWHRETVDTTDTTLIRYEILDTAALFAIPSQKQNNVSPIEAVVCYLYMETRESTISYYYFTPLYGLVGFLEYTAGDLKRTIILKQYSTF